MPDTCEFWSACPQCGTNVKFVARQNNVYGFEIDCDCSKRRKK
jgi:hypothetical protein